MNNLFAAVVTLLSLLQLLLLLLQSFFLCLWKLKEERVQAKRARAHDKRLLIIQLIAGNF